MTSIHDTSRSPRRALSLALPLALLLLAGGCTDADLNPVGDELQEGVCGTGDDLEAPSGTRLCVYQQPIVIETGFMCPASRGYLFDFQSFGACSPMRRMPQVDIDWLRERFGGQGPPEFVQGPWNVGEERADPGKLDLLWVVDDSGSMCQEQKILRDNFDRFIDEIDASGVDFHIGVTTTDMREVGGELVVRPDPVPGSDPSCLEAADAFGNIIRGDYRPIREALEVAVGCLEDGVDPTRFAWTDADIACAVEGAAGCTIEGVDCEGATCELSLLFPDPDDYRELPAVLKAADYRDAAGVLDTERLRADFACLSAVGANGYGVEAGLAAAITAVSPALTGGTAEAPVAPSAPNFGLVRRDARFAVVFVTDENDCSADPLKAADGITLPDQLFCSDDHCDYADQLPDDETPLYTAERAREALLDNLRATKGAPAFPEADVLVASIHGDSQPFTATPLPLAGPGLTCQSECDPRPSAGDTTCPEGYYCEHRGQRHACEADADCPDLEFCECPDGSETCAQRACFPASGRCRIPPSCVTKLGIAHSGERYERFLRTFPEGNYFPPTDTNGAMIGSMCVGDFAPTLGYCGAFLVGR